jgi:membrane protein implicated in regulation of membrane protease activity
MSAWVIWFIIAGGLAVGEILTGTFFLLLASFGALAAAGIAYAGYNGITQIFIGALVTLVGWFVLKKFRPQITHPDAQSNPDMNIDIGATVRIQEIKDDGSLHVNYRGSSWQAAMQDGLTPTLNTDYKIIRIEGSKLILGHN